MMGEGMLLSITRWRQSASVECYFTYALLAFILTFLALPSSKAVNNFYYAFMGLPALWMFIRGRWQAVSISPLLVLWAAFLLWTLLAIVQVQTLQYLKHWLYVTIFCALILLLVDYRFFRRGQIIHGLFYAVLAYLALSTVYLWLTGVYTLGERIHMPMRLTSPTYASIVLVAFFSLTIGILIKRQSWWLLGLSTASVLFFTGYILQSRAGVLGAAIVMTLASVYFLWNARQWGVRLILIMAGLGLAIGMYYLFETVPEFDRLIERADAGRFELWQAHYQAFIECHTLLGCAPVHFEGITTFGGRLLVEHPHNVLFSVLLYHGWIGLILFLAILVLSFLAAWRQHNPWGLFLLVSLFMLMFEGGGLINHPNELWLLVLLPCILILTEELRASEARGGLCGTPPSANSAV